MFKSHLNYQPESTLFQITNDMSICQSDYPLDWYQQEFLPYAEEYQALSDRKLSNIIQWMRPYIKKAQDHFGDELLLLAHYYMGGEIVQLIQEFGGVIGDSYQLALMAARNPERKVIVESAVHFMAESISILAHPDQQVYITNPKAGCTMEMFAKDFMVEPAITQLNARYGEHHILPVCYMNTSGRVKALTGAQGGAVCTSSNVKKIFEWALAQGKKVLFIPDRHMGENVAQWLNVKDLAYWPKGTEGAQYNLDAQDQNTLASFDKAKIILFASECSVHTTYTADMCQYWKNQGYHVICHPECTNAVMNASDSMGSTAFIWEQVLQDKAKTKKYAVATENHMVNYLKQQGKLNGLSVVNVAEANLAHSPRVGCGCATMSRNDPPHLVALLDLLRQGKAPSYNIVKPGDVVNEFSGLRQRLNLEEQRWVIDNARVALENMIRITERK
jgi:quinolinate synthase